MDAACKGREEEEGDRSGETHVRRMAAAVEMRFLVAREETSKINMYSVDEKTTGRVGGACIATKGLHGENFVPFLLLLSRQAWVVAAVGPAYYHDMLCTVGSAIQQPTCAPRIGTKPLLLILFYGSLVLSWLRRGRRWRLLTRDDQLCISCENSTGKSRSP